MHKKANFTEKSLKRGIFCHFIFRALVKEVYFDNLLSDAAAAKPPSV
jgi:hypothetical protein